MGKTDLMYNIYISGQYLLYTLLFKIVGSKVSLQKVYYVHQGCIHLIKNCLQNDYCGILSQLINICFQFEYILKCNLLLWWKADFFSIIASVFSVTRSFRNHSNMLICCSRTISDYQHWKQLYCLIFIVETVTHFYDSLMNINVE